MPLPSTPSQTYSTVKLARRFRRATAFAGVGLVILALAMLVDGTPGAALLCAAGAVAAGALGIIGIEPSTLTVNEQGLIITNGEHTRSPTWTDIAGIDPRSPNRNQLPVVVLHDGRPIVLKALRTQPASVAEGLEQLRVSILRPQASEERESPD